MQTIKENVQSELIIKKSKFICHLYYVNSLDEIKSLLEQIKKEYKDATHNCYAYILDNDQKMYDDGEPSGTAGMPILNILEVNHLNHILAVVTRYFGGIKLGASGLFRAYGDSVKEALNKTHITNIVKGYLLTLTFSYDAIKQIDYLIKDYNIINKAFDDVVTYELEVPLEDDIITHLDKYIITYQKGPLKYINAIENSTK